LTLLKKEELYNSMVQMWNLAMKRVLKNAEAAIETIESQYVAAPPNMKTSASAGELNQSVILDVETEFKNKSYQSRFCLPNDEELIKGNELKPICINYFFSPFL
jgi:hypothetical protein